jgi:hypothetical protein
LEVQILATTEKSESVPAPLEEKELLRRKWLLLLWGSVEMMRSVWGSCWIVEWRR